MSSFDILVVDDAYPMARALAYILSRSGYETRIARDGLDALEKVQEKKPDLMFLDLQMPRMGGLEACRRIRENPEHQDIYIIVLTGMGQDEDAARALEAGANECAAKPFSPRDVLAKVAEILKPVEP